MKKYKKTKQQQITANESKAEYLTFKKFSSFEEMNKDDLSEMAASSALERFCNVTQLLQQLFAGELKKKMTNLTIHFR